MMFTILPTLFCLFGTKRILAFEFPFPTFGVERSELRSLIQSHAFRSSVINEMVSDVLEKPAILRILQDTSQFDIFYFGLSTVSLITYFHYQTAPIQKWRELPYYKQSYRNFKYLLFVILVVFTKNIENAI